MGSSSVNPLGTGLPETPEPRSRLPFLIAGVLVLAVVVVLLLTGRRHDAANPGGAGLAPADSYAASLAVTGLKMSESGSLSGGKQTFLDGNVTNRGSRTVRGVTVQVAFHSAPTVIAQKETMPLMLVRMTDPYIDTQPVSASPIKPGESRAFHLIFDHVTPDWDGAYPELRIIQVTGN